ncbi:MAG: hypothetical protein WC637_12305 [Victivallales bacterium]|jgi:hypothetical protein
MPNRIIREGILTSDRIARLNPLAELFYRRLMSVVDDFGRYVANPTLLRASCYPLKLDSVKEDSIMKHLAECVDAELIVLYTVAGKEYLEMRDFKQQVRAQSSKYPSCEMQMKSTCIADATQMHSTRKQMLPKTETKAKSKKELDNSPKENEEKEKPPLAKTASCRLPPQSAYVSEHRGQTADDGKNQSVLSENLRSSFESEEKTGKGRPKSGTPGAQERIWIATGKTKDEYERLTKPPLPELSEDDRECLDRAGVELDGMSLWYYRRGKALIGEARFSELCHTVKNLKIEGKAAKKSDTARFVDYLNKEVAK